MLHALCTATGREIISDKCFQGANPDTFFEKIIIRRWSNDIVDGGIQVIKSEIVPFAQLRGVGIFDFGGGNHI